MTYWAFLSLSQQDNCEKRQGAPDECSLCWGDWLRDALTTFSVPAVFAGQINARGEIISERIEPVYQDQEEDPGNAALSEPVRQALEQSKCLIVLCSPRSAKSLQVNEQVRYFKQIGRGNRILPLVIAGEPNASEGHKPGRSTGEECFVPALRHPVMPDGTLDTSRRERNSIFADARHGDARQEILAKDRENAEIELETAKIQLIAGLIGVGFNGLWAHELKRRFTEAHILARQARLQNQAGGSLDQAAQSELLEAQRQAREALGQVVEARSQTRIAEAKVLEAQQLAREAQNQLEAARQQMREAQSQVLEAKDLPPDVKVQLEESQNKLLGAQNQAREALKQAEAARQLARELEDKFLESQNEVSQAQSRMQEIEDQARQTQRQLEAAQKQAWAAEANILETQQAARESEEQLEALRQELRAAQHQVLEVQNLPQDVKRRIEEVQGELHEAQDQARTAKCEAAEARKHAQELENQVLESQNQVAQAQSQVREIEIQARDTQARLAEAQNRASAAESQVPAMQQQVRDTENQLAPAHQKALELENKFQEAQNQVRQAQGKVQELEHQAWQTQNQLAEAQSEVLAANAKILEAQNKIQQIESQHHAAQTQVWEAQAQVRKTKNQVSELQSKNQVASRRTKVFAVLTVLALTAAGTSLWLRKQTTPAPVTPAPPKATEPEQATGPLNQEQIQQALQKVSGGGQEESRLRSLDELAAKIPAEEISNTLGTSSAILTGPTLSHFQELLLDSWMKTNLPAAFDWSSQLTDTNARERALEKVIPAMVAENPTNTLARLNDLKPAPDDQAYLQLFQRWAATDPVQAIAQRQQIPGQDAGDKILSAILLVWVDQQPAAALKWLESQPDSESLPAGTWRNTMMATLFDVWSAKDLDAATTACQLLPEGPAKDKAWECVLSRRIARAPAATAELVTNLAPGDYRQLAIEDLCCHWAETNATEALAWVPSLPTEAERAFATNQIIAHWAGKDPQAATQFAGQHPELSGAVLGEMATAWSQHDLSAATNWVGSLPDGQKKDTVLLALASSATERAPLVAAKLCTLLTTNQPTTAQVQGIATALAKIDVAGAVEWARSLKEDSTRQAALCAMAEPWAQNDPHAMAIYALDLVPGDAQTLLLTTACRQLAGRDLPGMVELLKPLLDAGLRQNILEQAGRDCDLPHLDQAAKCISNMPAGDDQQAALKGLLANWTATDPEAALNWLMAFPATNAQPAQVQSVIKAWSQPEPAAAAKWLANLPAGTANDEMVGAFLTGAVVKYPEYAAQWTQSVGDEPKRQAYQVKLAWLWMKTDAAAAAKWVDSLNLPAEIKQSIKVPTP